MNKLRNDCINNRMHCWARGPPEIPARDKRLPSPDLIDARDEGEYVETIDKDAQRALVRL